MEDADSLPKQVQERWSNWVNQVPILEFNIRKEYFVCTLSDMSKVKVVKKDNLYMFLTTPRFKFLDVKTTSLQDSAMMAGGCKVHKLVFSYEWLDGYDKLFHMGPVGYESFYSKLKGGFMITTAEYSKFVQEFHSRVCLMVMDWLQVYNKADVIPFIEAVDKTRNQYYNDEIDMLKDTISIPGNFHDLHAKQSSQDEEDHYVSASARRQPYRGQHKCLSQPIHPRSTLHSQMQ